MTTRMLGGGEDCSSTSMFSLKPPSLLGVTFTKVTLDALFAAGDLVDFRNNDAFLVGMGGLATAAAVVELAFVLAFPRITACVDDCGLSIPRAVSGVLTLFAFGGVPGTCIAAGVSVLFRLKNPILCWRCGKSV